LFLLNPIGLVITAIAAGAYLIWRNWDTLGPKFAALWDGIKSAVGSVCGWVTDFLMNWTIVGFVADHWKDISAITVALWGVIKNGVATAAGAIVDLLMNWTIVGVVVRHWDQIKAGALAFWEGFKDIAVAAGRGIATFFMDWTLLGLIVKHWDSITAFLSGLVGKFVTIGSQIMQGLISGFISGIGQLKNAINGVGENAINWFKEKLGIHSPSSVFAQLGGFTMAGLQQGIAGGQDGPLSAVLGVAKRLTAAGAGIALGVAGPAMANQLDQRGPMRATQPAAAITAPAPISIVIHAAPGMDEKALAQAVARELAKQQNQQAANRRSRWGDSD